ncbi:hypothetical protein [Salinarimonas chemoclinalis]|uniref:hypothetical protein n=1 Tax=Salinarimonas chemoclinalis TaxID=3241599 RepID=UPI003556B82F
MAASKRIAGRADWQDVGLGGVRRWLAPLAVEGTVTGMDLVVDAFPNEPDLRFTVLLLYSRCVMRLEYAVHVRHRNHPVRGAFVPAGVPLGWVVGPHCHRWTDNRALGRGDALPEVLEFAIPLPPAVRGFDNASRWFCGEAEITCTSEELPRLLPRETLL